MKSNRSPRALPYFGNGATHVLHQRYRRDSCSVRELKVSNIENFPTVAVAKKRGSAARTFSRKASGENEGTVG